MRKITKILIILTTLLFTSLFQYSNIFSRSYDIPDPIGSSEDWSWGVDLNDTLMYEYNYSLCLDGCTSDFSILGVYIFNVSAFNYFDISGDNFSSPQYDNLFYNVSTEKLENVNKTVAIMNASFFNDTLSGSQWSGSDEMPSVPYLLPLNNTKLNITHCAEMMYNNYNSQGLFDYYEFDIVNNWTYFNASSGYFANSWINASFFSNGTLNTFDAILNFTVLIPNITLYIHIERIWDYDVWSDTEFSVEIGDTLYYGFNERNYKLEITNISLANIGDSFMDIDLISVVKQVIANVSYWNQTTEKWDLESVNSISGIANNFYDLHPAIFNLNENGIMGLIFSNNATGERLKRTFGLLSMMGLNGTSYSSNYFKAYSLTTGDSIEIYLNGSGTGIIDQLIINNTHDTFGEGDGIDYQYLMSSQNLTSGTKDILLNDPNFDLNILLEVSEDTTIHHRIVPFNPVMNFTSVNNELLYLDLLIENSSRIATYSLKFNYNEMYLNSFGILKEDVELKIYNSTSQDWDIANYTKSINSQSNYIQFNLNHFSKYSFTGESTIPLNPSITINSGNISTTNALVILTLFCENAYSMRFSNISGNWTDWEAYSTTKELYLLIPENNNSLSFIFVQFKNPLGECVNISDSIIYIFTEADTGDIDGTDDGEPISIEWIIFIIAIIGISIFAIILSNLYLKKRKSGKLFVLWE